MGGVGLGHQLLQSELPLLQAQQNPPVRSYSRCSRSFCMDLHRSLVGWCCHGQCPWVRRQSDCQRFHLESSHYWHVLPSRFQRLHHGFLLGISHHLYVMCYCAGTSLLLTKLLRSRRWPNDDQGGRVAVDLRLGHCRCSFRVDYYDCRTRSSWCQGARKH